MDNALHSRTQERINTTMQSRNKEYRLYLCQVWKVFNGFKIGFIRFIRRRLMFNIIKKVFNILLDYIAYVILAVLGIGIFSTLYLLWFTDSGRVIISMFIFIAVISWSIARVLKKRKQY